MEYDFSGLKEVWIDSQYNIKARLIAAGSDARDNSPEYMVALKDAILDGRVIGLGIKVNRTISDQIL